MTNYETLEYKVDKIVEQFEIQGKHFSHLRKDITETKSSIKILSATNSQDHKSLASKVDYTNGTTRANSKEINNLNKWKYGITLVGSALWLISGFLFIYILPTYFHSIIKTEVSSIITDIQK